MPFEKGDKRINRKGRKPGTTNERIKELREKIYDLVNENYETLQIEFKSMKGKEKFQALSQLLKFCLPPPPSEDLLKSLSDSDLDILIEHLRKQIDK